MGGVLSETIDHPEDFVPAIMKHSNEGLNKNKTLD